MRKVTKAVAMTLVFGISAAFADPAQNQTIQYNTPAPATQGTAQMQQQPTAASPQTTQGQMQQQSAPASNMQAATNASQGANQTSTVPQTAVVEFSQQAALTAFSYNYKSYQQDLQKMQSYFTKDGWDSFNKALTDSNNLQVVQKERLTVNAKLNGTAQVLQHENVGNNEQWQIQVPVQVTYINEQNQQIQQNLLVKMAVTTVNKSENPLGIGIRQFIAMPAPASTTVTPSTPAVTPPTTTGTTPNTNAAPTPQTDTNP